MFMLTNTVRAAALESVFCTRGEKRIIALRRGRVGSLADPSNLAADG
jgi:hypothetical protein